MPSIEFGSLDAANEVRSRVTPYLDPSDHAGRKTVTLVSDTPSSLLERVESEAFASQKVESESAGNAKLTDREREKLKRQYDTFSWQSYGFEAMRTKAALESKGATEWMDFYEPGEGIEGALSNLQSSKESAGARGTSIGVGGQRTDHEETSGKRRRQAQVERMNAGQVEGAKPAAFRGDADAAEFLREEEMFNDDLFDISFRARDGPSGRDYDELKEAHESRSARAQRVDERRSARVTRDPLEWAQNKSTTDYPGIDTVEPERIHSSRSSRAQKQDEREIAPRADTREQWANHPDRYDWPGVDTPRSYGATKETPIPREELERDSGRLSGDVNESLSGLTDETDFDVSPAGRYYADEHRPTEETDGPMSWVLAGGEDADAAFTAAEESRAGGPSMMVDDRPEQGNLVGFGMETDATQHRKSRHAEEVASTFGIDDRQEASRGAKKKKESGEQQGFEVFGGGVRENETLF